MKTALLLSLLFTGSLCLHAQDKKPETIFKVTNQDAVPDGEKHYFGQFSVSIPLRSNPYRDEYDTYTDDNGNGTIDAGERDYSVLDYIWPDGLSIHYGMGLHYKKWVGISANAGIDWLATGKLVNAPVYAALFFSPQFWDTTNLYLQAGYGYTFALGREGLGGVYQKYRAGLNFDNELVLYLEVNQYGFRLYDMNPAGSISIGFSITGLY